MSSLGLLEEDTPQQYKLKVMSELLVQAHILGIDLEEFVGFFAAQIQAMLSCPPNYNFFGQKERVWIMRGFYPETQIFFKIILMGNKSESITMSGYYAKVSPMRVTFTSKSGGKYDDHVIFEGRKLNEDITNRMENAFFGADHKLDPIIQKKVRMPRCMSPRGMKIFRYKKPSKRSKRETKAD